MLIRKCDFCSKEIEDRIEIKRFCNKACQEKQYNRWPKIKENRIRTREYRKNHPEWKERHRILTVTKHRKKRAEYWNDYEKRPEVRARIREKERLRRKTDLEFAIKNRLKRSLRHALTKYSGTGKIMSSEKYGINWEKIIENLRPLPENVKDFKIDHIKLLYPFNLTNSEEIKKAFDYSNLQ